MTWPMSRVAFHRRISTGKPPGRFEAPGVASAGRLDLQIVQGLAAGNGRLNPLGLQASAGPRVTGGRVAVFRGHSLAGIAALLVFWSAAFETQVIDSQAMLRQQLFDAGNHARALGTLGFLDFFVKISGLFVQGCFLGEKVLV